jgi:hypothetical protein
MKEPLRAHSWADARCNYERGYLATTQLLTAAWPPGFAPADSGHAAELAFAADAECGVFSVIANLLAQGRSADALIALRAALEAVRARDPALWTATRVDERTLRDLYRAIGHVQPEVEAEKYRFSEEGRRIATAIRRQLADAAKSKGDGAPAWSPLS